MKKITIQKMAIQNFKGISDMLISFGRPTSIYGENGSGKTTVFDAFHWVLFDSDSNGSTKFDIRPLDADGKMVNNVEIMVSVDLIVDGRPVTFTKTEKQKWVKKRGSEAPTFQGNERNYEVDAFPVSQKEFQARVADIVSEDLFTLVTSPKAFPAMKWQDQRKILMGMADEVTDEAILDGNEEYGPIREDVLAAGADKALEKARKTMAKLKEVQKAYPIRIDEASKSIAEKITDAGTIEQRRIALTEELQRLDDEANAIADSYREAAELKAAITKAKYELIDIDSAAQREAEQVYRSAKAEYDRLQKEADSIFSDKRRMKADVDSITGNLKYLEARMEEIRNEYMTVKAETLPDGSLTCPTCGQAFPDDKANEIVSNFAAKKQQRVADVKQRGDDVYAKIKAEKARITALNADIEGMQAKWTDAAAKASQAYESMGNTPQTVNTEELPAHIEKQKEIYALQEKLSAMDDGRAARESLNARKANVRAQLDEANRQYALIEANAKAESRVAELTEELKQTSQKVADQERIVYLLEQFNREKMDALSMRINDHFNLVRFKLFDQQINGAIKDTCEMTVNGVPYASLNSASKVQGGLDVINALSDYYQVSAPIFIDNRESTSSIPDMDAQIINLYVSEPDKQLRIEYE